MIPSPSPDPHNEDACRAAAARLQHDHKNWLVLWGCYTHSYVAFPLFPAPRGTILTASTPGEMTSKMRREERVAGARIPAQPGSPGPCTSGSPDPDPYPPPQDWPGPGSLPPWACLGVGGFCLLCYYGMTVFFGPAKMAGLVSFGAGEPWSAVARQG